MFRWFMIAVGVSSLGVGVALAHQAPSGWSYPQDCCSGTDCARIDASDVHENGNGSYTILATGEVFSPPGKLIVLNDQVVNRPYRWSGDGDYHRCKRTPTDPKSYTLCLFIPAPSI